MGAITGIAILVGGIGIMIILLASVAERTREIGIRKAAGARNRDILFQFLAESVVIAGVGSIIGVVLGLIATFVFINLSARLSEASVSMAFNWLTPLAAAGIAIFVGLVFGMYPAVRAARLQPVDAIRYE
jgi:putative ABC transport system permease protein